MRHQDPDSELLTKLVDQRSNETITESDPGVAEAQSKTCSRCGNFENSHCTAECLHYQRHGQFPHLISAFRPALVLQLINREIKVLDIWGWLSLILVGIGITGLFILCLGNGLRIYSQLDLFQFRRLNETVTNETALFELVLSPLNIMSQLILISCFFHACQRFQCVCFRMLAPDRANNLKTLLFQENLVTTLVCSAWFGFCLHVMIHIQFTALTALARRLPGPSAWLSTILGAGSLAVALTFSTVPLIAQSRSRSPIALLNMTLFAIFAPTQSGRFALTILLITMLWGLFLSLLVPIIFAIPTLLFTSVIIYLCMVNQSQENDSAHNRAMRDMLAATKV